eukprot:1378150-Karenia_brevis.AAC.1
MMLKDVPKTTVMLANPMDATTKYDGGKLVDNNPNMNLGPEHINTKHSVCDLTPVLPETSMTAERWAKFFKAIVHVMPEDKIDDMWEYAKLKPSRRKAWRDAKDVKHEQHTAEHTANMKAATSSWQTA